LFQLLDVLLKTVLAALEVTLRVGVEMIWVGINPGDHLVFVCVLVEVEWLNEAKAV
jgi:hypothetical protein